VFEVIRDALWLALDASGVAMNLGVQIGRVARQDIA